jgi:hypothetical protein
MRKNTMASLLLAVARKLVAYLMAVDRGQCHFQVVDHETCAAAIMTALLVYTRFWV